MIEFKYDDSGVLIAYKDGERVGSIQTMGDNLDDTPTDNDRDESGRGRGANGRRQVDV